MYQRLRNSFDFCYCHDMVFAYAIDLCNLKTGEYYMLTLNRAITVGIPCEIMSHEGRVPILPSSIHQLILHLRALGCVLNVVVQKNLGSSLGMTDENWVR
ncbi:MAG: hypothetical protein AAB975_02820, partial [Patescibacteria group bacterium]